MPDNTAVWLPSKGASFHVGTAPYTAPGSNEIVVRVRAIAVNPIDRLMQTVGGLITSYIRYPFVLGSDVAGEVVQVGSDVSRFRVGDRVLGHAAGSDKLRNRAAEGAFQTYVVLLDYMTSPLPADLSYEAAAVLPLALSTAACGLFQKDFLGLNPPMSVPRPKNSTVVVWGGSTSVGSNAIQLAKAAGYDVLATVSPHNFDYARRLGASRVFDYRSESAVADMIEVLRGGKIAGALAIGAGSASACIEVVGACEGNRFVAMATPPASFDGVPAGRGRMRRLLPILTRTLTGNVGLAIRARRKGVRIKFIWGSALVGNEVGPMIYETFLPEALAQKRFVAAPPPIVVGHGFEYIPEALDLQLRGVSARKLVVTV